MPPAIKSAKDIFLEAVGKTDPAERANFLREACGDDAELLRHVEALVRAHQEPDSLLDQERIPLGMAAVTPTIAPPPAERSGTMIGPYKLLQEIGEGGMGVVYMAEQSEPVQRRVALKIIKPGMDTRQVIARFEAERQALAMMDHPNIAKVFDAGTTGEGVRDQESGVRGEGSKLTPDACLLTPGSGRPYFVMELVRGIPITKYCDEHHLTLKQRLELFLPVCQAVQHAHQKGVIHRDLKPSNVLVAQYDDKPVPKVIDFGVAKAAQKLTERTMFTEFGQVLGTLEYMSPEQARLNQLDIDTRSDIYSLGVLLYELLTGCTPFEGKRLRSAAFDEMLRIIREEEPPKPSTRLSTADTLPSIAASRSVEPARLGRTLRGELDWIVMRAMEKDRNRRYESAAGLARDVERYLHDEPIEACPPSVRYRLWKFLSRNRAQVLAAGLLLLALVAGIIGTTWGLVRAERALAREAKQAESERQAKEAALAAAEAEKKAKQTAEIREAEARAVLDFLINRIFAAARPEGVEGGLGRDVTLREALDAALPALDAFKDQPLIEAKLRMTLGLSYDLLGEETLAHDQLQAAHTLYSRHAAPDDQDTLWSTCLLAGTYAQLGRLAEAVKLHEETLALRRAKLGPTHFDTLFSMHCLAGAYHGLGRHEESLRLNEETLALQTANLGANHARTLDTMGNLAQSYLAVGRHADALRLNEKTLALRRSTLGPEHPHTLWSMNNLAETNYAMGRYAEALKRGEETLALRQAKLGPDHRETLMSMQIVADSYAQLGHGAEAIKHYEVLLTQWEKRLGPDHRENADRCIRLAWCLAFSPDAQTHDPRRAVALAERAVKLAPEEGGYWRTLGVAHYRAGDWKAAVAALDKSISLGKGEDDWCLNWIFLAMAHWQMGDKDEARKWYDQATTWIEKSNTGDIVLRHFQDEAEELLKKHD